jgi:hypothetical protein
LSSANGLKPIQMHEMFAAVNKVTDETQTWTTFPVFSTPFVIPGFNGMNRSQERLSSERREPRERYVCLETEEASRNSSVVRNSVSVCRTRSKQINIRNQEYGDDDNKIETSAHRSRAQFGVHRATSQNWDHGLESCSSHCLIVYR